MSRPSKEQPAMEAAKATASCHPPSWWKGTEVQWLQYQVRRLELLVSEARVLLVPPLFNHHPALKPQWLDRRDVFMEESS